MMKRRRCIPVQLKNMKDIRAEFVPRESLRGIFLRHRLDDSLSWKERNWGTTDVVTEDVGADPQEMHLTFLSPEAYGYDPKLIKNADVIISANVTDPKTKQGGVIL